MNTTIDMTTITEEPISRQQLARLTGTRDSTIKFYSECGLLPYTQAGKGLARRYDARAAVPRLRQIAELKLRGLNIEQITHRLAA